MLQRHGLEILNGFEQGVSYFLFALVCVNEGAVSVEAAAL